LDFFVEFRLFEFFSSIGNELFVSATSGGSVEEFSLTNDADLQNEKKKEKRMNIFFKNLFNLLM